MALQDQIIPLQFGQGIDTKTDPKAVMPAKVLSLIDGIFTNPHRASKRNGYDLVNPSIVGGGTITSPLMVESYNEELICADGTSLYSYSPTLGSGAWVPKGFYPSVSVTEKQVAVFETFAPSLGDVFFPTMVSNGLYSLFAYTDGQGNIFASVMDNSSQVFLIQDQNIASSAYAPQAALLSGSTLAILYGNSSNNLVITTASFSATSVSFNSPTLVISAIVPGTTNVSYSSNGIFNFVTAPLASTAFSVASLSSSGSVLATATPSSTASPSLITCQADASNNVWIYWIDPTTPGSETLYYTVRSSSLSIVKATTSIVTGLTFVSNISPSVQISGDQFIYYSTNTVGNVSTSPNFVTTQYAEVSTSAVVSSNNAFLTNLEVETNWVNYLGINYAVFGAIGGFRTAAGLASVPGVGDQDTFFLISEKSKLPFAKCFSGSAFPNNELGGLSSLLVSGNTIIFGAPTVAFKNVENLSGDLVSFPVISFEMVIFNFDDFESYQATLGGNVVVLNGGIVQMYDGKYNSELGFNVYPENVIPTPSTSGGKILDGTYTYAAVYEWYDGTGNFHSSAPQYTAPITFSGGVTAGSVAFEIQTLSLTQKQNVQISIYRTTANGLIFYKIGEVANTPLTNYVTFTDTIPDSQIQAFPDLQLYTDGNVVENNAPPPAMVIIANPNTNRVLLINSENPTNSIWYCKTYSPGTGLSFSNLLSLTINPSLGNMTSLAVMDEKTCILKQGGIAFFTGDGSDDTGANSTITNPQIIPSDVGCLYSRGTALTPDGVMFKTTKGIYLLSRGLSVEYIGADVEAFNSQNIESALIASGKSQVRFLTSSGYTLVYDYIFKQWSQFSNHQGYSSTLWNNYFVYCRTGGSIFIENGTTFLDNASPYSLTAQLAWLKLAGIQGFQRVRSGLMLGDHISPAAGHGIQISAAYDFVQSFSTPISSPSLPISGSSIPFQYREFFPRQKCDSLSLLIQEVTTGASGEYCDFTDLTLEIGIKRGYNKLPATSAVG